LEFSDDKECRNIESTMKTVSESIDVNFCWGNQEGLPGDVSVDSSFNELDKFKCDCPKFKVPGQNKAAFPFSGNYCEIDNREKIIRDNDLCSQSNSANSAKIISKSGKYAVSCICRGGYAVEIVNSHFQRCNPAKTCGIDGYWTEQVKYNENCDCPKVDAENGQQLAVLTDENCSTKISDDDLQNFCRKNKMCNVDKNGNRCSIDVSKIEIQCECDSRYFEGENCRQKSCSQLCNTSILDKNLKCSLDFEKPESVNCSCQSGFEFFENGTVNYCKENDGTSGLQKSEGPNVPLIIGLIAFLVIVIAGFLYSQRNKKSSNKNLKIFNKQKSESTKRPTV